MRWFLIFLNLPLFLWAIYDSDSLSINRWRWCFENYGRWGRGYWPYSISLRNYYISGGGVWIGCIDQGETLATIGYNITSGTSEMVPSLGRYWRKKGYSPYHRIYKYPGDWPPPKEIFPFAPQEALSDMELWCCFSDYDPKIHEPENTRPIGIDVALTVYGFKDLWAKDFFFLKYELFNNNPYPISDAYFGIVLDGDIGYYGDDLTGFILDKVFQIGQDTIRIKNTALIYDYDNIERPSSVWTKGTPGAIAIRLLHSSLGNNLRAFKILEDWECLSADALKYLLLAGYNPFQNPPSYVPYDTIDTLPEDKKFLISSGPFTLFPCSTATFYYAVIGSPFGDSGEVGPKSDTTELIWRSWLAELVFQERLFNRLGRKEKAIPTSEILLFPNPFRSSLFISGEEKQEVNVQIFNANGQLVKFLCGQTPLFWDGKDEHGERVRQGVYFLRINGKEKKKVILTE